MNKWTVREVVGQEYIFEAEAETLKEAIHIVEMGRGGRCLSTQEIKPQYTAYPKGFPAFAQKKAWRGD
uniref:Uncharacterized protein n=1 Tax=viral metagenome TaxID=1070528 RepID=A0A6M3KTD1_9ZZZZ